MGSSTAEERSLRPRAAWLAALMLALACLAASTAHAARWQTPPPADIPQSRLFDLGVADYNGDGLLDIFSTNHKARAVLLRNQGGSSFADVLANVGLSPTPAFPGLEYLHKPPMTQPGIYLWATDPRASRLSGVIHLKSVGKEASGNLTFGASIASVIEASKAGARKTTTPSGRPSIDFHLQPGGELAIRANHIDLPIYTSFKASLIPSPLPGSGLQPRDIRVGTLARPATSRRFILNLRDRHSFVFADILKDGGLDAFVTSGGLGGAIKFPGFKGRVQDELLLGEGGRFENKSAGSGLSKGSCRARQAAAVDVDANGLLDLFESCEGELPKVYLKRAAGPFSAIVSPPAKAGTYRWAYLRGRRPALLAAERSGVEVLRRVHNRWHSVQRIRTNARNGAVAHFSLGDIDGDGDLDVLAVSPTGNTMLRNDRGRLRRVPLSRFGLPAKSVAASFVDYDNDARQDLSFVPQGLYRGTSGKRFQRTGQLRVGKRAGAAIMHWFDANNDGLRDPLIALGPGGEFSPRMTVVRKLNRGPGGHWLEVELSGDPGNRQAIGARVAARTGHRVQYQWVGQNEESRHSQGHYRLYFGLGQATRVDELVIRWPRGRVTKLHDVAADRLLRLSR